MPDKAKIDAERVRRRMRELGIDQKTLAERCRVNERTIRNWLSGDTEPFGEQLDKLAAALDIGTFEVVLEPPQNYRKKAEASDLDSVKQAVGGVRTLAFQLWGELETYLYYLSLVQLVPRPTHGYVKQFQHDPKVDTHYYAIVRVRPTAAGGSPIASFTFSFGVGGVFHTRFGGVDIDDGAVRASYFWGTANVGEGRTDDEGWAEVWTWFGGEACTFFVDSAADFELKLDTSRRYRDARQLSPGAVIFAAASHHVAAAREA